MTPGYGGTIQTAPAAGRFGFRAEGAAFSRIVVNPETQRRNSAKAWEAKSEVAKVRKSLDLTQEAFADLPGIGISTLRSWEQNK